ncbi:MAG: divalent-cation tolerance protein CutA [Planctomycetota bacterium]|nr:hypothetical protein [Planctomycetota bacterium]MDP6519599.1 divalent-cation tolerance protein CutA [Planctomycetota bacterium]MDP6839600.1 divalent-cation tolerance protein CutA [Planctomycetota bacterium]MDP6955308.1 divalent-cation tolerance protein CutA [Planctomycetota bacterium]
MTTEEHKEQRPTPAPGLAAAQAARLVCTSAPDEATAHRLARDLVQARLAACVQCVPGATSIYRWENAVEEAREVLLSIKTRQEQLEAIAAYLAREHPYDLPELVVLTPESLGAEYLAWLLAETET